LKYYNPPNFSYPDEVSIVNISDVEFRPVNRHGLVESSGTGKFVSRILGSVRVPSDAGKRNLPTERMSACVDYASMLLRASHSAEGALDVIQVSNPNGPPLMTSLLLQQRQFLQSCVKIYCSDVNFVLFLNDNFVLI
jgi:hypothetical protein